MPTDLTPCACDQGGHSTDSNSDSAVGTLRQRATLKPDLLGFHEAVARVCALLDERHGLVSTREMARIIGRSYRQSRRIFHDIAGESFRLGKLRARLVPARILVRNTSIPISEIAEHFQYSRRTKFDQSYLHLFGLTPAADRAGQRDRKMATQGVDGGI